MYFVICKCYGSNFLYKKVDNLSYKLLHVASDSTLFEEFNKLEFEKYDDISFRLLKNKMAESFISNLS